MLPFAHHISNQPSSAQPGASAPQQVPGSSTNLLPNLMQINSQTGFVNPQSSLPFNNPNTHMGYGSRPPGLMNFPQFNGHLGNSILGSAPQNFVQNSNVSPFPFNGQLGNLNQGNPGPLFGHNLLNVAQQLNQASGFQNGQFGWPNQVQNLSQLGNMPTLNPSQVAALAQLMGCANQVAQSIIPQTTAFAGNPQQLGLVQPNGAVLQTNLGQQMPMTPQQMPMTPQQIPMTSQQMLSSTSNPQHSQFPRLQGNPGKRHGMHISNSDQHRNKNFLKSPQRDASNPRFQKHHDRHMHNTKGKHKFSDEKEGNGIKSSGPDNAANNSKSGNRRSMSMFYSEKEIQQWREERKKHYPSKANVEKKLADKQANADAAVEAAKLRRQQLKDVLAKQVELGFEVPEIPSHYLLDPEEQCHGNKNPLNSGRFQNRFNKTGKFDCFDKKRGREGNGSFRKHEQFAKRKRGEGDDDSSKSILNSIKKQTLLQKLLSTDIKRDHHCLLQALRFMVMNSFFKDWPDKSLDFSKVIVKETVTETETGSSDVIEQKPSSLKGQLIEDHDTFDDGDGGHDGCQEEGEITD